MEKKIQKKIPIEKRGCVPSRGRIYYFLEPIFIFWDSRDFQNKLAAALMHVS